ncbi:SDR family oxidoreductase [Pseudodesulfovibrio sp.]|uniref:SDR family oxidoreductase n=1 Tax=Pseudodesulfovibrio sp. TaxID=2035812 RepID=UPI00263926D5|nr:SDR family oxidoreductase [Pseudodesulfovibrio sp.]MDD3313317.1 SDR family oxidoreductase [Pseudodesulfovibrio sp.]
MSNLFNLAGKTCIITGGLGQLGRQFTFALHSSGANVVVLELAPTKSQVDEFDATYGDRGCVLRADVTDKESLVRALEEITRRFGVPAGLINNAALDSPPGAPAAENGPFEDYPEASFDKIMEVNVKGTFLCCQVFGGAMAKAGRGSIVNISSTYGVGSPCQDLYEYRRKRGETFFKPVAYSVSKSAVLNLTRYLATYWGESGVRVNTLTFGGVFNHQEDDFLKAYTQRVPVRRMANENEYNGAVVYLMSESSSYMTGSNMVIDGGWTAW